MNRLTTERQAVISRCLAEGNSIRSTCRMTGAAKATVEKLLRDVDGIARPTTTVFVVPVRCAGETLSRAGHPFADVVFALRSSSFGMLTTPRWALSQERK
jgi:hypothetical protein